MLAISSETSKEVKNGFGVFRVHSSYSTVCIGSFPKPFLFKIQVHIMFWTGYIQCEFKILFGLSHLPQ